MRRYGVFNFRHLLYVAAVTVLLGSCKSVDPEITQETKLQAYSNLKQLIDSKEYRIDIKTIQPFASAATTQLLTSLSLHLDGSNTGIIDVRGEGYYLEVSEDMVQASMPFYGEAFRSGGNPANYNLGVDMDSAVENYKVEYLEAKQRVVIKFDVKDGKDQYDSYHVNMKVWTNKRVELIINSAIRTSVRYRGLLTARAGDSDSDS